MGLAIAVHRDLVAYLFRDGDLAHGFGFARHEEFATKIMKATFASCRTLLPAALNGVNATCTGK
jgi:hypothetical protein